MPNENLQNLSQTVINNKFETISYIYSHLLLLAKLKKHCLKNQNQKISDTIPFNKLKNSQINPLYQSMTAVQVI